MEEELKEFLQSLDSKIVQLAQRLDNSTHAESCHWSQPSGSSGGGGGGSFHSVLVTFCLFAGLVVMSGLFYRLKRHMKRQQIRAAMDSSKGLTPDALKTILGDKQLPSWVNFPDFERASWINKVIAQLWPRVQACADQLAVEQLQPLLDASKPLWVNEIKIKQFDVGDTPPTVSGIKAYEPSNEVITDQVLLEFDFSWGGKQDIHLSVKPLPKHMRLLPIIEEAISKVIIMKVTVTDIICSGRMRVSLKPLMNDLPIVAAVQVSFVETPKFSFNTKVYGGDLSYLPGLDEYIDWFISSEIISAYVLPEKYVYPLIPGDLDTVDVPCGMLFIKIIEATDVPSMDYVTKSDVFCRVWVNEKRGVKTAVKYHTKHPVWEEDLKLLVHMPEMQALTVELRDWDLMNTSDRIGRVRIPIKSLPKGEKQDMWLELQDVAEGDSLHKLKDKVVKKLVPSLLLKNDVSNESRHDHHEPAPRQESLANQQRHPANQTDTNGVDSRASSVTSQSGGATRQTWPRTSHGPELDAHHSHGGVARADDFDEQATCDRRSDRRDDLREKSGRVLDAPAAAHTQHTARSDGSGRIMGANQSAQAQRTVPGESSSRVLGASEAAHVKHTILGERSGRVQGASTAAHAPHTVLGESSGRGLGGSAAAQELRPDLGERSGRVLGATAAAHAQHTHGGRTYAGEKAHRHNPRLDGDEGVTGDAQTSPPNGAGGGQYPGQGNASGGQRPGQGDTLTTSGNCDGGDLMSDLPMAGTVNGQPLHAGASSSRGPSSDDGDADSIADSEARMAAGDVSHRKRDKLRQPRHHPPPRLHLEVTYYEFDSRHLNMAKESRDSEYEAQGQEHREEEAAMANDTPAELRDILRGGVLIVKVKRAFNLVHKPAVKLGMLKKSAVQVRVEVAGTVKKTAEAQGTKEPAFHDFLEFVLGGEVAQRHEEQVTLEVWDYQMINHFKGRIQIPLREVIRQKRLQSTFPLQDTKKGQLEVQLEWLGILEG